MGYHDNEKTTKKAVEDAVRFINDRERYKYLCQILMDHFGFGDYKITDMLMKARNCQFEDIKIALVSEISNCYDDVDLMRDEFKRIKVISKNKEIDGICDRALARSKRITPVIDEINELKKQREHLEQWISAIADDHKQVPDWIQQSARSLLANSAT